MHHVPVDNKINGSKKEERYGTRAAELSCSPTPTGIPAVVYPAIAEQLFIAGNLLKNPSCFTQE